MQCALLQDRFFELKSRLKNNIFPKVNAVEGERPRRGSLLHVKMAGKLRARAFPFGERERFKERRRRQFSIGGKVDGTIYISSTHNNTIYTLVGADGNIRCCVSTGTCGFKNARKSTSYASQAAAEKLGGLAKRYNISSVAIKMRGLGPGKLSGVRALQSSGMRCTLIDERTPLPHNGCRPSKVRRI